MRNAQCVIISGGTSGIGLATAQLFLNKGFGCAVVGRSRERFESSGLRGKVEFIRADVREVEDCARAVKRATEIFSVAIRSVKLKCKP